MRSLLVLSLGATVVITTSAPTMGYDPATTTSCVEWYNNNMEHTCEYVRDYFNITPEQFAAWNPSVGLDCSLWDYQSYCIVTKERNEEYSSLHPTTTATPTTTEEETSTSLPLGPSPTAWRDNGCFVERTDKNILDTLLSGPDGDDALTIPKCEDECYRQRSRFTGVKNGNECWCSNNMRGLPAKNETECDLPCTGDKATICGGQDRVKVFEAAYEGLVPLWPKSSTTVRTSTSSAADGTAASPSSSPTGPRSSSGAVKNAAIFGGFQGI